MRVNSCCRQMWLWSTCNLTFQSHVSSLFVRQPQHKVHFMCSLWWLIFSVCLCALRAFYRNTFINARKKGSCTWFMRTVFGTRATSTRDGKWRCWWMWIMIELCDSIVEVMMRHKRLYRIRFPLQWFIVFPERNIHYCVCKLKRICIQCKYFSLIE